MQKIAFLAGFALCSACAGAADVPDARPIPKLSTSGGESSNVELDGSLAAYVDHALVSRPELQASVERWRAQKLRIDTIDELPSPVVRYFYFLQPMETLNGPQRHRAAIEQPFLWPGKAAARKDVERARELVAERRYDAQALDIAWQVADAYWRLWEIERIHAWHEQHISIVAAMTDSARSLVETGRASVADVGMMEIEHTRRTDLLGAADATHHQLEAELAWAAGLDLGGSRAKIAAETPTTRLPAETEASLIADAARHPQVLALMRMQAVQEQAARAARTSTYPDFALMLEWTETGESRHPDAEHSGRDHFVAGVSLKLPFWTGESRAAVEAAEAEQRALEADAAAAESEAARAVRQSLAALRNTARRVELYSTTLIPQADVVLGSVEGAYETGQASVTSLLSAQHELLEMRIELVAARAAHEREWAKLERVVGRPVPGEVIR